MNTSKIFLGSLLVFLLSLNKLISQEISSTVASLYSGPNWGNITDTGITCSGGPLISIIRDDGTYENGYRTVSTGDSTTYLQRMVMPSVPFNLINMCVTWTAQAPSGNLTFDLIIYDTLGSGGIPGNVVYRVNNMTANSVGIFPQHTRYTYPISFLAINRAYYVGVRWNNNPVLPFFISADENGPVSTMGLGYARLTTTYPPVFVETTTFSLWKGYGIRLEGFIIPPPGRQDSYCRTGINIPLIDFATTVDSLQVILGSNCTILDVNVKITNVTHTWDSDLRFYLRKGNAGSLIIDRAGGSGDNFVNTILNDSASVPIASGTAPFTGSFRPTNPLTVFNFGAGLGDGYWKLAITDTASGDIGTLTGWCLIVTYQCPVGGIQTIEIPNYYSLSQNFPNPFNPVTQIKFTLPQGENVKLVVFDILGREVKTLVNEFRNSGVYEVSFDASEFASGVYFYRLDAGEYTATKKMLVIK
ncbi:MAG: T9SS type A sorting domain-containing protein [Ignavibacteria bacterium]